MTDIYSKAKRSDIMSRVRATETKPEKIVRSFLFAKGLRFRKNCRKLPGRPDIVLPKYKSVVFVNGCFWHGHKSCKAAKIPKSRQAFWMEKIGQNRKRDKRNIATLKKQGWNIIVVWQCQIESKYKRQETLNSVLEELAKQLNQ